MKNDVALREFRVDSDFRLLRHWLAKEHVSTWWGDPRQAFEEVKHRPGHAHAVIVLNGVDVGYACWERPVRKELEEVGLGHLSDTLIDVDLLLGDERAMGKGVAQSAGRIVIERLRAAGHHGSIGVGMSTANIRAIRAAEKAGFRSVHEFNDPEHGLCRYMILAGESSQ